MDALDEQARYYRERAPEYDDWWFRRGRYALPPAAMARWNADVREVEEALDRFAPHGDVLELAAGTGLWTQHLVRGAQRLTIVDASAEMIALNRARVGDDWIEYVEADLFAWRPPRRYDVCFFSFWLSHVPEEHFEKFWDIVAAALGPRGRVFLLDSGRGDPAHTSPAADGEHELRRLADGRQFTIVKRYWEPRELESRLAELGWTFELGNTRNRAFLYGSGSKACLQPTCPRV